MKKVLIINYFYANFTGSEILTKQIAEYFEKKEYDVYIASLFFGESLIKITNSNIKYINILTVDEIVETFEIVWSHHSVVLSFCIFNLNLKYKKLILSVLSPYEPMEALPPYYSLVDLIIANSHETKEMLLYETNNNLKQIEIFHNSVEKSFFRAPKKDYILKKVAVISNHIPQEVRELEGLLNVMNIDIHLYGKLDTYIEITPEIIQDYDLIITIGKTVQYAFASSVPVYVYDHFGGPGFLSPLNYLVEEKYNFSGRGNPVIKTSTVIFNEIINYYSKSIIDLAFFHNIALAKYDMNKNITSNIDKLLNLEYNNFEKKIKNEFLYVKRLNLNYFKLLLEKTENILENEMSMVYVNKTTEFKYSTAINLMGYVKIRVETEKLDSSIEPIRFDPFERIKGKIKLIKFIANYTDSISNFTYDLVPHATGNFKRVENNIFEFDTTDPQIYVELRTDVVLKCNYIEVEYIFI